MPNRQRRSYFPHTDWQSFDPTEPRVVTRGTRGVLPTSTTTTAEAVTSSNVRVRHEIKSTV